MQMKIWTSKYPLSENRCPGGGKKEWTRNTGKRQIKFYISYKKKEKKENEKG